MTGFEGKKALVLGGSRGIGASIVRKLASAGARVSFTYVSAAEAAEKLASETGATAVHADSADRDRLVHVVAGEGPIDILVANAGIGLAADPLTLDPAVVDRMVDINVRAPYFASVEAARTMPDNGRIVIIGSLNGERVRQSGRAAYGMTKAALQSMVRGFARDFGARGITVNLVQPGPVDTDANPASNPGAATALSFMAIKRYVLPDEVADLVLFLAGPNAAMITGSVQNIDGGHGA
jgi:cyclic-di-GMP-binding biofilm dispersal mediator protein